jgi:hypothetical protein
MKVHSSSNPARGKNALCRRDFFYGGVLLLVWLSVSLPRLHGPIDLRWDASTYFILGTALAEGKGYRLLNEPGEIQAVQYPPLLPGMIALTQRVMGTSDYVKVGSALRIIYFVLSGLYLVAIYALARTLLAPLSALAVGLSAALSFYSFLHPSDTLYAELPFALIATLFLLFHRQENTPLLTATEGLLGTAAYFLRTAGLALLAAWIAESLLRHRYREALIRASISALPILLWQTHIWRVTQSEEYWQPAYSYQRAPYYYTNVTYGENSRLISPFQPELGQATMSRLPMRLAQNLAAIPIGLGESALVDRGFGLPGHWRKGSQVLSACLFLAGLTALTGACLVAAGRRWFLPLYFALTIGLIVLTPWPEQFWRYLAPLTPLTLIFIICALIAGSRILRKRSPRWGKAAGVLALVVPISAMLVIQAAVAIYFLRTLLPVSYYDASGRERKLRLLTYRRPWHSLDSAFEWVRRHAKKGAVVGTAVPQMAYLRTEHKTVLPPFEPNVTKAARLLDEVPVDYLVIDQLGEPHISDRYAAPVVVSQPKAWRLVFTAPDAGAKVYERVR